MSQIRKNQEEIKITKEELKKAMAFPGKMKGAPFKADIAYILAKKGVKGLEAIEKETAKLGYPIQYQKIKETEWYPIGLRMVVYKAMINVFGWGKKEIAEFARIAPKVSFVLRFFMRYFTSPERMFRMAAPRMWQRYFNFGSIETLDFKKTKKGGYASLRIKDFQFHPFYCFILGNFFVGVFKLAEPRFKEITFKETKCMFRGDDYHEFLIEWTYW